MARLFKNLAKSFFKQFGIGITSYACLQDLIRNKEILTRSLADIRFVSALPDRHAAQVLKTLARSHSQLRQDLFALSECGFKRNGFFVEFGATNGCDLSNTYVMEKDFGWSGILVEPAKYWHDSLKQNRNCSIETDCVWSQSNTTVRFHELKVPELSTIDSVSAANRHVGRARSGKFYDVKTISLADLLDKYAAPAIVDYLSIDTEGSEYAILSTFNFEKYKFRTITCEHNFTSARERIFSMLTERGYVRKFEAVSGFDDWYVNMSL